MSGDESKSGFALLDLLRRRQELQIGEVIDLLASLPGQLDRDEALCNASLLRDIRVVFEKEMEPRELNILMGLPTANWPEFKLSPQQPPDDTVAVGEITDTHEETMVQRSAPAALASLIYELLGGRQRPGLSNRLPPIAALGEKANDLLHRAVTSGQCRDARAFWRDFVAACATQSATRRELRMSAPSLAELERGTVCKLTPRANGTTRIHLIARPSFRIGRSAKQADFIARFLPDTPENVERTSELSRVHVLLEFGIGGITLRDGDGARPSHNGSTLEDVPLSSDRPMPLGMGGVLSLGSHYRMNVTPMPAPKPWKIVGVDGLDERDEFAPVGMGAVAFEPLDEQRATLQAAWLFDAAGFFLDEAREFRWHLDKVHAAPAFFLRRGGGFLLTNVSSSKTPIRVDSRDLMPGEVVPLRSGQSLRIGDSNFTVTVS